MIVSFVLRALFKAVVNILRVSCRIYDCSLLKTSCFVNENCAWPVSLNDPYATTEMRGMKHEQ